MAIRVGRKNFTTKEDIEKLKELYNKGYGTEFISDQLKLSKTWVLYTCKRLRESGELQAREKITKDIQRRNEKITEFKANVDIGKVFALWHAGWTIDEIAKDMELNSKQVEQILDSEV